MPVSGKGPGLVSTKSESSSGLKYYGIYRARCINNQDPRGLGRILAHIYQRDGNLSYTEDIHQWIPVLSPYGGVKGMGFYMIPPIHAEGFVIFEGGIPSRPVWIGTFPYAPPKEIDEEASKSAGYGIVKVTPTIPPELQNDPTTVVLKTQYPALGNPDIESNDNKVENLIVMDETKLELVHINQNEYEYNPGGVSSANASSYLRLTDNSIAIGVKGEDGKVYEIQIDNTGIRLISDLGDTISIADGEISIQGSDKCQISIRAMENGSVNINGKQVVVDGEQIIIGPPGTSGGGGVVTSDCICPFTGMPTHVSSGKTIVGG
jgi:hypothetical protein